MFLTTSITQFRAIHNACYAGDATCAALAADIEAHVAAYGDTACKAPMFGDYTDATEIVDDTLYA